MCEKAYTGADIRLDELDQVDAAGGQLEQDEDCERECEELEEAVERARVEYAGRAVARGDEPRLPAVWCVVTWVSSVD